MSIILGHTTVPKLFYMIKGMNMSSLSTSDIHRPFIPIAVSQRKTYKVQQGVTNYFFPSTEPYQRFVLAEEKMSLDVHINTT